MLSAERIKNRETAIKKARFFYHQLLDLCKAQVQAEASRIGQKADWERDTLRWNPNYFTVDGLRRVRAMQYMTELNALIVKFDLYDDEITEG